MRAALFIAVLTGLHVLASCAGHPVTPVASLTQAEARQEPITTRELVDIKLISVLSVSPDQRLAVVRLDQQSVGSSTARLIWKVIDLPSGNLRGEFDGGEPLWNTNHYVAGETPHWSPDSRWIYFRKLIGQDIQIWRSRLDGTEISQVTRDDADVVGMEVRDDGSLLYAVAGATRVDIIAAEAAEYASGVLMGPSVIVGYPLAKGWPVNGRMAAYRHVDGPRSGRRGTLLGDRPLRVEALGSDGHSLRKPSALEAQAFLTANRFSPGFDFYSSFATPNSPQLENGEVVAAVRKAEASNAGDVPQARSGEVVSWRRRGDEIDTGTCTSTVCLEADMIQVVGWRPGSRKLVIQTEERGVSRLLVWDTDSDAVQTLWKGLGVLGSVDSGLLGGCQLANQAAVCIAAAGDKPPRIISIDLETSQIRLMLDPNPELTPSRLGVASIIELSDKRGSTTYGTVILPHERPAAPLPLVMTSYSCRGFLQGGSGRDVPEHVLASLGYAVICIDLGSMAVRPARGFVQSTEAVSWRGLEFIENAIEQLAAAKIADVDRVALAGFSGSASMTVFAIPKSHAFTTAIITTGGTGDAASCYLAAHYRSCEANAEGMGLGWPYDSPTGYLKNSPAWNADKITASFLMQLPESEYRSMLQLYGALLHYNRAVEMYVFPEAYHYKHDPGQRLAVYNRNVDWINFWLKGLEPRVVDASDITQRWRELRTNQCAIYSGDPVRDHAMWYCR